MRDGKWGGPTTKGTVSLFSFSDSSFDSSTCGVFPSFHTGTERTGADRGRISGCGAGAGSTVVSGRLVFVGGYLIFWRRIHSHPNITFSPLIFSSHTNSDGLLFASPFRFDPISLDAPYPSLFKILFLTGDGARYSILGAITAIVTNHYRPRRDATELDARKVLTRSLAQLATSDQFD